MTHGMLMHVRANPLLGTSRLLRGLTLARRWIADGGEVIFVTGQIPGILLRQIAMSGCDARYLSAPVGDIEFARSLCRIAGDNDCTWILTDDTSKELLGNLASIKKTALKIVVLGNCESAAADFTIGNEPAFALIRKNLEDRPPLRSKNIRNVKRCLVDLTRVNSDDAARFLKEMIRRFTGTGIVFDVVTPFSTSAAEQLRRQQAPIREYVFWHRNPDRVFQALDAFHLAVMSDTADFFETAYSGTASILVIDRPFPAAASFDEVTSLPWMIDQQSGNWVEQACDTIQGLLGSPTRLSRHESEMSRLVDNQGAARLCQALREGLERGERVRSA